jgi:hypothetical protein
MLRLRYHVPTMGDEEVEREEDERGMECTTCSNENT